MKAYHFHNGATLRDGSPLPPLGHKLVFKGKPVLCESGLHFSLHPFDALGYAPGPFLDIVEVGGVVVMGDDKGVATERTRIKSIDATSLLRKAARMFASNVLHLWQAPDVVKEFLATGREDLRKAAAGAAWAARNATEAATRSERDAAWAAEAAEAAARAAGVAERAARAAARAAREAAEAATRAAGVAAWAARAARDAEKEKQRKQFLSLVNDAFKGR